MDTETIQKLRERIKKRTTKLGIKPDYDDKGHFYVYKGQRLPSVTGRLQILKDPSLSNYKRDRALDFVFKEIGQNFERYRNPVELKAMLEDSKSAADQLRDTAGDIGTAAHDWREVWFKGIIDGNPDPPPLEDKRPQVISATRAVQKFVKEHDYHPVACELYVADTKLYTGGMVDDIGFVDGELALVDLKTSNIGDKEQYHAQVALYYYMFAKLYGLKPDKLYILHASKKDGSYDLIPIPDIKDTIAWAKRVVEVTQFIERIKNNKKRKVDYL
jgi:hypothetical protein